MKTMKTKTFIFWIKSGRGTDSKACFSFPPSITKPEIEEKLKQWCSGFACWEMSDGFCSYGFKEVYMPPRNMLLKRFNDVCDKKEKIQEKWDTLAAMLNPILVK